LTTVAVLPASLRVFNSTDYRGKCVISNGRTTTGIRGTLIVSVRKHSPPSRTHITIALKMSIVFVHLKIRHDFARLVPVDRQRKKTAFPTRITKRYTRIYEVVRKTVGKRFVLVHVFENGPDPKKTQTPNDRTPRPESETIDFPGGTTIGRVFVRDDSRPGKNGR